jgi:hypothetical protein
MSRSAANYGWSFANRSFLAALVVSVLWHLFWFFVVTVKVQLPAATARSQMRIYFIGPVLNDDAFNLIVQEKPELSKTVYRNPSFEPESLEPSTSAMNRRRPGDLTSVPFGRNSWKSFGGVLSSTKPLAGADFIERFSIDIAKSPFTIEGALKDRGIFTIPPLPKQNVSLNSSDARASEISAFEITVNPAGEVVKITNLISGGDPSLDLEWRRYLKSWEFLPLPDNVEQVDQKGTVHLEFK